MKLLKTFLFLTILFASNNIFSQDFQNFLTKGTIEPKEFTVTFPFELYNNWIVIKTTINGVEGDFIFDTGCSVMALDSSFAAKCRVNAKRDLLITGNGASNEKIKMKNFYMDSLHFGGMTFKDFGGVTFDTKYISEKNRPIAGLIGANLINKMNWKFDFDSLKITVSSNQFEQEGTKMYFWTSNDNVHRTNLNIDSQRLEVMLDLGSGHQLLADLNTYKSVLKGLKVSKELNSDKGSAGISREATYLEIMSDFDFYYSLDHDTSYFEIKPRIELVDSHNGIQLGTGYFKYFNFVINTSNRHYILKRNHVKRDTILHNYYPITINFKDEKVKITRLRLDKFVEENKVKLNDEIIKLDGKSIKKFKDWADIKAYIKDKMDKKLPYTVKIKGQKKAIEIRESVCDNLVEME
jgi:Aspartyl protease